MGSILAGGVLIIITIHCLCSLWILLLRQSVVFFFRCNFALMLLAELVLDQASVDWAEHLPLMLHVIFLGE